MKFDRITIYTFIVFALSGVLTGAPTPGRYLDAARFDLRRILPDPPAPDSLAGRADLETARQVRAAVTPEQVALAQDYDHYQVFHFAPVVGLWFTEKNLPKTAAFFAQIDVDAKAITRTAKNIWNNPRPPLRDATIQPLVPLPESGAYPSGHTTQAHLWAGMLATIFPEQAAALHARAKTLAWTRVVAGVHYPSDITGGQILGEYLAAEFLKNPDVQAALTEIRAEMATARVGNISSLPVR